MSQNYNSGLRFDLQMDFLHVIKQKPGCLSKYETCFRGYHERVSNIRYGVVSLTTMRWGPVLQFKNLLSRPYWSRQEFGGR